MFIQPSLSSLTLHMSPRLHVRNDLIAVILPLHNLTNFEFDSNTPSLPNQIIVHLSSLAHLRSLSLYITEENCAAFARSATGQFLVLERLELRCARSVGSEVMKTCLDSIQTQRLCELRIHPWFSKNTSMQPLFAALSKFHSLRDLHIFIRAFFEDDVVDSDDILPLLTLKNIRTFELNESPIRLTTAHWTKIAIAWQSLESLTVIPRHTGYQTCIPIECLTTLARHCLCLQTITLETETLEPDWAWQPDDMPDYDTPSSPTTHINLQRSLFPPDTAGQVAVFLSQVFPLASISHTHPPGMLIRRHGIILLGMDAHLGYNQRKSSGKSKLLEIIWFPHM